MPLPKFVPVTFLETITTYAPDCAAMLSTITDPRPPYNCMFSDKEYELVMVAAFLHAEHIRLTTPTRGDQ